MPSAMSSSSKCSSSSRFRCSFSLRRLLSSSDCSINTPSYCGNTNNLNHKAAQINNNKKNNFQHKMSLFIYVRFGGRESLVLGKPGMHGDPELGEPPQAESDNELPLEVARGAAQRLRALPVHQVLDEMDAFEEAASAAHGHVDGDGDRRGERQRQSERDPLHAHLARRLGEVVAQARRHEVHEQGHQRRQTLPQVIGRLFLTTTTTTTTTTKAIKIKH